MPEQELHAHDRALIDAFLKRVSYKARRSPTESVPPKSRLQKAAALLRRVGPFGLLKAAHRRVLLGDIHRLCSVSAAQRRFEESMVFDKAITFSITVPLYNTPLPYLNDMIASVQAQTYPKWELCLADGSDSEHAEVGIRCRELAQQDRRIVYKRLEQNEGIAGNTNACLAMATGEYISLFDHDDLLHPSALYETMCAIAAHGADLIYTDEAIFETRGFATVLTYHYKPDFAVDNLRANNYICHFTSFSRELLQNSGPFRHEYDGSQDHDMILRLAEHADRIVHVREPLYFWRSHSASVAAGIGSKPYAIDAGHRAVHDSIRRVTGMECTVQSAPSLPSVYTVDYALNEQPLVSVVIASDGDVKALERCVASVLCQTTYRRFELILAHSTDKSDALQPLFEELSGLPMIRTLPVDSTARATCINRAVAAANGDYVLLLDDKAEVITPRWIEHLLMYAVRPDVGAVGAMLLYPDNTIRHAGYILGMGRARAAGLEHHRFAADATGSRGRLCYARNASAVSDACLLIQKSRFEAVGGLEDAYLSQCGDADLCLRLKERGYVHVFTPHALLYHHIPYVRDAHHPDTALLRERWGAVIDAGDPYYNPHLSLDHVDCRLQ